MEGEGRLSCGGGGGHGLENRERGRRGGFSSLWARAFTLSQTGPRECPSEKEQTGWFLENPSKRLRNASFSGSRGGVQWISDSHVLPSHSGPRKRAVSRTGVGPPCPHSGLEAWVGGREGPQRWMLWAQKLRPLPVTPASQLHASGPEWPGAPSGRQVSPLSPCPTPFFPLGFVALLCLAY